MILHSTVEGQGEPLVVLHGLLGASANFGALAKTWAAHFQVIRLDLRNHGRSPHHASMAYAEMAADVIETLDELGVDKCHLLGHSMGGKVAMTIALTTPDRVTKLLVADIAPVHYAGGQDQVLTAMSKVDLSKVSSRQDADAQLTTMIAEKGVRLFVLTNLQRQDDGFVWRVNLPVLMSEYAAIRGFPNLPSASPVPSLFVHGSKSNYVLPEHAAQIAKYFPRFKMAELVAGHWVHAEQATEFSAIALDWFRDSE